MITKTVLVTQFVDVTIDETKFTDDFIKEFKEVFYDFEDIDEHIKNLAQLYARGVYDNGDFIEGYGDAKNMGIKFEDNDIEIELLENI
jgi:hypothetical protein